MIADNVEQWKAQLRVFATADPVHGIMISGSLDIASD
jgi:hypothetical protein